MMKIRSLTARNYRSIRDATIELGDLSLFIGANATGKSAILDALRLLSEAVRRRDFRGPALARGGMLNLAWKGQEAGPVELTVVFQDGERKFDWTVRLVKQPYDFYVIERVRQMPAGAPPVELLNAERGEGWWRSGEKSEGVQLLQGPSVCALAAAAADASFPARQIAEFVSRWGFFDPNPFLLRRDWNLPEAGGLDPYGRNLAETLHALPEDILNLVTAATQSIVGLPNRIEPRAAEERFYFVQDEPGLRYPVNQMGVSSGTLRALALMTALYGQPGTALIGIEELENYAHPTALNAFVEHIMEARQWTQFLVTTHSPLLLDYLDDPAAVNIVKRDDIKGTTVQKESNPEGVRKGLEASGFVLGEYHQTMGFGG